MRAGHTTLETTLDFDDEQDVEVIIYISANRAGEWELHSVERASDGSELVLTSDLNAAVSNYVNDNFDEVEADLEGAYADYCYELHRDQMEMES